MDQLHQQVKMIGHQAVVIQPKAEALPIAGQQHQEGAAILVIGKDDIAVELNRFAVVNAVSPHSLAHPIRLFVGILFFGFRR